MRCTTTLLVLGFLGCQGDIDPNVVEDEPTPDLAELPEDSPDDSPEDAPETEPEPDEEPDDEPIEEIGDLVGLELEVTFESWVDDALVCAKRVAVTGTPYTGECAGCDFAFMIEGTLTEDNSESGCYVSDYKLLRTDSSLHTMMLAHADTLEVDNWGTLSSYADVLFVSYYREASYYGSGGPYVRVLSHAEGEGSDGVFSRVDTEIEWGAEVEGAHNGDDLLIDFCDPGYESYWDDFVPDGSPLRTGTLPCDGRKADVWSITIDEPMMVEIAVDTIASDTAFDPKFFVVGEDECVDYTADDNFDCTFPPPSYQCPAIERELAAGSYEIVVAAFPNKCAEGAEAGEYTLMLDAEVPIRPALEDDDVWRYEQIPTEERYSGVGELIFE
jgi:hypothetical protein